MILSPRPVADGRNFETASFSVPNIGQRDSCVRVDLVALSVGRTFESSRARRKSPGMIGCRARAAITAAHRQKVEPVDHLHNEPRQMLPRKPLVHGGRQQKSSLPINRAEVAHQQAPSSCENQLGNSNASRIVPPVKSDRLLEVSIHRRHPIWTPYVGASSSRPGAV